MEARIDKLVFGGQGMGKTPEGKIAFVWNALPGEEVELDVIKNKKNLIEANASRIILSSAQRRPPEEKHFLACSPWQIMSFDEENRWKVAIAKETYQKIGGLPEMDIAIAADPRAQYRYRNKIEYSFAEQLDGTISLAFFERGRRYRHALEHCILAREDINRAAHFILDWINAQKIPIRSLKTMIVRTNSAGQTIAGLFIKDRLQFPAYPACDKLLIGFSLYYSTHKSPASVPTELLHEDGANELEEKIGETSLRYGLFSFFQINVPLFQDALRDIEAWLDPGGLFLDYYSGVGSIGLPLAKNYDECLLVESNAEAVAFAQKNIAKNKSRHVTAAESPAERMQKYITPDTTLVLDPPREGLHADLLRHIAAARPRQIAYLSCNLSTQARDLAILKEKYFVEFLRIYNFFPRTPHIEGLCVLKKISDK